MSHFLLRTRYLILLPILGLATAAAFFFVFGGIGLIHLLYELALGALGLAHAADETSQGILIFEVVEYVHTFLVGTVLFFHRPAYRSAGSVRRLARLVRAFESRSQPSQSRRDRDNCRECC